MVVGIAGGAVVVGVSGDSGNRYGWGAVLIGMAWGWWWYEKLEVRGNRDDWGQWWEAYMW